MEIIHQWRDPVNGREQKVHGTPEDIMPGQWVLGDEGWGRPSPGLHADVLAREILRLASRVAELTEDRPTQSPLENVTVKPKTLFVNEPVPVSSFGALEQMGARIKELAEENARLRSGTATIPLWDEVAYRGQRMAQLEADLAQARAQNAILEDRLQQARRSDR